MRAWLSCLLSLFICPPLHAATPPTGRLDQVLANKVVRVCIWPDYYGISFRNPKTQVLSGIDIDLAGELANAVGPGVKAQFVDSSFATLVADLKNERCDIAMFAVGVTPARQEHLRFTRPYLRSDIFAITTKSNRSIKTWNDIDQQGVVVAVHKGTYHEQVMREKLKHASLLVADTPFAREQEVESGRADVFMTDYPYSQRMLRSVFWARLLAPPEPYHLSNYAYAVLPGDDRWFALVEQFVASIKRDGRLQEAAKRHKLEPIVYLD